MLGGLLLAGVLILPVTAYLAGGRLAGTYAGSRGLASYLGTIYGAAGRGRPLALILLLAPVLIAGVWGFRKWLLRSLQRSRPGESISTTKSGA